MGKGGAWDTEENICLCSAQKRLGWANRRVLPEEFRKAEKVCDQREKKNNLKGKGLL